MATISSGMISMIMMITTMTMTPLYPYQLTICGVTKLSIAGQVCLPQKRSEVHAAPCFSQYS